MLFLIKINLVLFFFLIFFFSVTSQLLESIYTVLIFHYECRGCAKSSCFWSNQSRRRLLYPCDVISNFPPALWLKEQR